MLGEVSLDIPAQDPQSVKQVSSSSLSDVSQPCSREMQAAGEGGTLENSSLSLHFTLQLLW